MVQMSAKRRTGVTHLAVLLIVFGMLSAFLFSGFFPKYIGIKVLALLSFSPVLAALIIYIARSLREGKASIFKWQNNYPFILIVAAMLVAYLPLLTQPFLFGDDLWGFGGRDNNNLGSFLGYFRCLASIPNALYSGIYWGNSNVGRCITFIAALAFAWLVYRLLLAITQKRLTSLVVTFAAVVSLPMADILGFLSVFPMVFGMLFSVFSVSLLYEAHGKKNMSKFGKLCLSFVAVLSLFIGFNCYIISTPIVFVFCAALVYFSPCGKREAAFIGKYAAVMVVAGVMYYAVNSFACQYYEIAGQSARGQISFDPAFYGEKIIWFCTTVVPKTIYGLWMSLSGSGIGSANNNFWGNSLDPGISAAIIAITAVLFVFMLIMRYRQGRRVAPLLGLIALVPASFYPFLLLPESSYISYYAYPLFCVLVLYVILSARELVLLLAARIGGVGAHAEKNSALRGPLCVLSIAVLVSLQVSAYSQKAWVNFCTTGYTVAKNAVMSNHDQVNETKHIHVYGSPHLVGVNVYPVSLIDQVISDTDISKEGLVITASTDERYVDRLQRPQYETLEAWADPESLEVIRKYYTRNEYYDYYQFAIPDGQSDEAIEYEMSLITKTFNASGLIPLEQDAVFIDYRTYWQWVTF